MTRVLLALVAATTLLSADLSTIRSEPNPERRSRLALDQAAMFFDEAKTAYAAADPEKTGIALHNMQDAVEIARDALESTGKDPRRHTKPFKMAETATHDLIRKLDGLENSMDLEDRKLIEGPKAKVQEVHDEWLNGIISGKH